MENKSLFFLEQKFKNVRDALDGQQLFSIGVADQIVEKALESGMERGIDYHDIYKLAKNNVEAFSEMIKRTNVPRSTAKKLEEERC